LRITHQLTKKGGMHLNELKIFKNPEFGQVRVVEKDGQPWFVAKDVAIILGYSNSRDAISKHVDEEDKGGSELRHPWRKTRIYNY